MKMALRFWSQFREYADSMAVEQIHMIEEVKSYIATHKKPPVIIFDLYALPFYRFHLFEHLYGGRPQITKPYMSQFFDRFKELNVIMYFVRVIEEGGKPDPDRIKSYDMEEMIILKCVAREESAKSIFEKYEGKIPYLGKTELREIAAQYGRIVYTQSYESSWNEMGALALKYGALAVITDKRNILLYGNQNDFQVWVARMINLQEMTTIRFNFSKISEHFNLPVQYLPVLGIFLLNICRNKSTDPKLADILLKMRTFVTEKFFTINEFIEFLKQYKHDDLTELYKKIVDDGLTDTAQLNYNLMLLQQYYDVLRKNDVDPEDPLLTFIKRFNDVQVYRTLLNSPYAVYCSYFDSNRYSRTSFLEMVHDMLERRNGVLLNHKKNLLLKRVLHSRNKSSILYPTYPLMEIPPLSELLDQMNFRELDFIRYEILIWILNFKLSPAVLMKIPESYFITFLTLYFLTKENYITIDEADVIMIAVGAAVKNKIDPNIVYPKYFDRKAFHLPFLFNKIYTEMHISVNAVGLFDKIAPNQFDGVCFHHLYSEWMQLTNSDKDQEWQKYEDLKPFHDIYKTNDYQDNFETNWRLR